MSLSDSAWRTRLNVQAPYRWNLQRLDLGRTLDVGCGIGRNLANLDGFGVGVDHNVESVAEARSRGFRAWTSEEWPSCPDAVPGEYDTILVAHVLEHMSHDEGTSLLVSYLPYLKAEGRLVMICPQERGYATDATHVRFVTNDELTRHASEVGMETVKDYSFPFPRLAGKAFPYNEFVVVAKRPV